jgi:hypothetical protein
MTVDKSEIFVRLFLRILNGLFCKKLMGSFRDKNSARSTYVAED